MRLGNSRAPWARCVVLALSWMLVVALTGAAGCSRSQREWPGAPPVDVVALNNRGVGLMGQFDFDWAADAFARASAASSDWLDLRVNQAIATLNRQRDGDAAERNGFSRVFSRSRLSTFGRITRWVSCCSTTVVPATRCRISSSSPSTNPPMPTPSITRRSAGSSWGILPEPSLRTNVRCSGPAPAKRGVRRVSGSTASRPARRAAHARFVSPARNEPTERDRRVQGHADGAARGSGGYRRTVAASRTRPGGPVFASATALRAWRECHLVATCTTRRSRRR